MLTSPPADDIGMKMLQKMYYSILLSIIKYITTCTGRPFHLPSNKTWKILEHFDAWCGKWVFTTFTIFIGTRRWLDACTAVLQKKLTFSPPAQFLCTGGLEADVPGCTLWNGIQLTFCVRWSGTTYLSPSFFSKRDGSESAWTDVDGVWPPTFIGGARTTPTSLILPHNKNIIILFTRNLWCRMASMPSYITYEYISIINILRK